MHGSLASSSYFDTEHDEYHTTDSLEETSPHGHTFPKYNNDRDHDMHDITVNELVQSIRKRTPNFLADTPSTRELNVVQLVQHISNETERVHLENQSLRFENERLRAIATNHTNQVLSRAGLTSNEKFAMWYRREVRLQDDLYLDRFIENGCDDLRVVTSPGFTRTYMEQNLKIGNLVHQTKILAAAKSYPNWTKFDDWLVYEVGLESYLPYFECAELNDMNVIRSGFIDDKILTEIGISRSGHRMLILQEIARLREKMGESVRDGKRSAPSVDLLLKHCWNELRELISQRPSRPAKRNKAKRPPRLNDEKNDAPPRRHIQEPLFPPRQQIPPQPTFLHGSHGANGRVNQEVSGPPPFERGAIRRRRNEAAVAPIIYQEGRLVQTAKNPYARANHGIARSYSAPNLARSAPVAQMHSTNNVVQRRASNPCHVYKEVKSLSGNNLAALRKMEEMHHRQVRARQEELIERSTFLPQTTERGMQPRRVHVNVITPLGIESLQATGSAKSTDVNMGSRESSR